MREIIVARDIEIVTAEIVTIKRQAQQVLIHSAIEIGRRLTEAKAMVPFGEWGKYLEERVEYSQSTANNLMKIYKEYGSDQESLFDGFAKSQTFANLNYTQALALLSVPEEEREKFAQENNVEHKSTREIQELIRQRNEDRKALTAAETAVVDANNEKLAALRQLEDLKAKVEEAERTAAERARQAAELTEKLSKAKEAENNARAQLKAAKENPTVSEDQMAKIRREAEEDAIRKAGEKAEKETKRLQAKLDAAMEDVKKANSERERALLEAEDAKQELERAKQKGKLANPDVAVFKNLWEQIQNTFNQLNEVRIKILQADKPTGTALSKAIEAMLEKWESEL